ncbi:protein of unknown function [Methylocaldum szegediense]|uniref:Uncharacterized protein n=1 Tax=Methylocaldum szegediense TaxID=73780 RepID=A0ABN8X418_9GAMM|nr:protein of unknown function [Methylocaldum szegediense]
MAQRSVHRSSIKTVPSLFRRTADSIFDLLIPSGTYGAAVIISERVELSDIPTYSK